MIKPISIKKNPGNNFKYKHFALFYKTKISVFIILNYDKNDILFSILITIIIFR
jgi:hypothetical protein